MRISECYRLAALLKEAMGAESSAKNVAADLGKPYFTLMAEINGLYAAEDAPARNKLGLLTTLELLELTDARAVLEWLVGRFGFLLVPRPDGRPSGEALQALMMRAVRQLGEVADSLLRAAGAGASREADLDGPALERFERQCVDAMIVISQLLAGARAAASDAGPAPEPRRVQRA